MGLGAAVGLATGLEKAANNLWTLQLAKTKLTQEKELFDLDKKQKDLEIKKLEYSLDPEQIKLLTDEHKARVSAYTAAHALANIKIEQATTEEKRKLETYQNSQKIIQDVLSGKTKIPAGMRLNLGGGYGVAQANPVAKGGTIINLGNEDDGSTMPSPGATQGNPDELNSFLGQFN
jgi:hypothetical protein